MSQGQTCAPPLGLVVGGAGEPEMMPGQACPWGPSLRVWQHACQADRVLSLLPSTGSSPPAQVGRWWEFGHPWEVLLQHPCGNG